MNKKIGLLLEVFLLALLIVFAFWMTFQAGTRGFFAFDQSIVFDGGYRVLAGQIPYRDFIIPIGPVTFWIQAVFFSLLGVNYYSYIFTAAFFNVLAALLAVGVIRLLFPERKVISYGAGFLTAVWFYPPSGTPWMDQTAFFFCFLALYILLLSIIKASDRPLLRTSLLILTGFLALVAFLSKQNAGLFFLPLFPILLLANHRRGFKGSLSECAIFFAAFLLSFIAYLAWVHLWSDLSDFLVYFFKDPSRVGSKRIFVGGVFKILGFLVMGGGPVTNRIAVAFSCLFSAFVLLLYCSNFNTLSRKWWHQLHASLICLYCCSYQYLFLFTTKNDPENCFPFLGIIFGIGAGLVTCLLSDMTIRIQVLGERLHSPGRSALRLLAILFLALLFLYSLERGRALSLYRSVHEVFARPVFNEPLSIDKLRSLRWGKFTKLRPSWYYMNREGEIDRKKFMASQGVNEDDITSLLEHLRGKGSPFFVFPDYTILYGLSDAQSPQPLLWFHRGLTYTKEYDREIDRRIVNDLKKSKVDTIILEEDSFHGTNERLDDFPVLKSYIDDQFKMVKQFGIFNVYEKSEFQQDQ